MGSLRLRLLVFVSLLLIVFSGAAIAVLDNAFRDAAMRGEEERLDIQLIALLAAAEPADDKNLALPEDLQEQRFAAPGSGLYAAVFNGSGKQVWRSRSTLGTAIQWAGPAPVGTRNFQRIADAEGTELLSYSLGVDWEFSEGQVYPFSFQVVESLDSFRAQVAGFRGQLFGWFAVVSIGLLVSLALLLGWLLRPLAQIEAEIRDVEQGEREALSSGYPSELSGVARNLNALVTRERSRGEVYRRTLGDLAHSLKTPLATLRTVLGRAPDPDVDEQLTRMDELIRYQLSKPATRGRLIGTRPFAVEPHIASLTQSFEKIYFDKGVSTSTSVAPGLTFRGDTGDFMELVGNVMDNAFKRCDKRVRVTVDRNASGDFELQVGDDGPGFPADARNQVTERGARLDEAEHSQGLGLSIVAEICALYGAEMRLGVSQWNGALVTITVPNP